ncbi:MAG: Co2+/Mg2+ efflux protein ApaG [Gammaproteobacteria bacterium]
MTSNTYDIEIAVDTTYVEEQSHPEQERYVFAYHITITNGGTQTAQLISRHWIITDATGHIEEVKGEGVIGEQPTLAPGDSFKYTSAAMISTPVGTMHGSYQMRAEDGNHFDAPIAAFRLSLPNILH